jgi:hypothetical protein
MEKMYTVRGFILSRLQEILKTVTKSRSMRSERTQPMQIELQLET